MSKWWLLAALEEGTGGVPVQRYLGGDQFCRSRSPVYQGLRGVDGFLLSKLIGEYGINPHHSNLLCVASWGWGAGCRREEVGISLKCRF